MRMTEDSTIQTIFDKQKQFFKSGKTKELAFKKQSLQQLKQAVLDFKEEIYVALDFDLGKSKDFVLKWRNNFHKLILVHNKT